MSQRDAMPVPPSLQPYIRTLRVGKMTLHGYLGGSGSPPVVLIHGLGDEADTWQRILPALAQRQMVAAFDLPGFGRSDKPRRAYTLAFYARMLEGLLDALGLAKATLVGHSLGAAIGQRLAIARPHRVERLVLIDGCLPFVSRVPPAPFWAFLAPLVGELGYTSLRRSQEGAYATLRPYYRDLDALPEGDRAFLRERVWARVWSSGQRRAFLSAFRWLALDGYLRADSYRQQLQRLQIPTDIIWGAHDLLQPLATGEALARLLPNARLHIIPDGGHNVHQEQPETVARIVDDRRA